MLTALLQARLKACYIKGPHSGSFFFACITTKGRPESTPVDGAAPWDVTPSEETSQVQGSY